MTAEEALSWTLIHFLWQGAVIGLATMFAFWVTRRPASRYLAGCAGLAAMGGSALGTFAYLWGDAAQPVLLISPANLWDLALPWVNRFWAAGMGVLLVRALGGWWVARRRTQTGCSALVPEWESRAAALSRRLGLKPRRVRVFESAAVAVPMVFGWLRPVVLLPACALSGMSVAQVEALLAHELAHVRRHDYLVNLLQTALESALFYHPAVWWVSARVRRERELCCDEVAVEVCGDRLLYSKALLRMEEARVEIALAASGGSLKERIGRVLGMSEKRMSWTPAWLLGGVVMICMGVVWARTEQAPPPPPPSPPPPVADVADPPPPPPPPRPPAKADQQRDLERVQEKFQRSEQREMERAQERSQRTEQRDLERAQAKLQRAQAAMQRAEAEINSVALERAVQQAREGRDLTAEERARMKQEMDQIRQQLESIKPELREKAMAYAEQARRMAARAPLPPEAEIERRIKYAEDRFSQGGVNGMTTDRGKTYLKLGPPDEIETHAGDREVWRYRDGDRFIVFDAAGKLKK